MQTLMAATWRFEEEEEERESEEKWVKHYSSFHQILLVGDGDFSFSLSLAMAFGSASNIVATSLDSYDVVIKNYKNARANLEMLDRLGAYILHGVDATKMKLHTDLRMRKFDRIIYNFPHAGFLGKEDNAKLIRMHQNLVHGFFRNAGGMLRANGEIHVNHKTTFPFCQWNIGELAWQNSLFLTECVDFKKEDYPGYNNKRGAGDRCDEPFPLGPCSTFKFIISPTANKTRNLASPYINRQQLKVIQRHPSVAFAQPYVNQLIHNNKRGAGAKCDEPFPLGPCSPFKFIISPTANKTRNLALPYINPQELQVRQRQPDPAFARPPVNPVMHTNYIPGSQQLQVIERQPDSVAFAWPPLMHANYVPGSGPSRPPTASWIQCCRNFNDYLDYVMEMYRETNYSVKYLVEALRLGFERYEAEKLGRPLSYYVNLLIQMFTI